MRKMILLIILLLFISSCQKKEEVVGEDVAIDNEITNVIPTPTAKVDEFEGYYEILDGLYINKMPGYYEKAFDLEFKFANIGATLYYTLDCSVPTKVSKCRYRNPIEIAPIKTESVLDYKLTSSVNAILSDPYRCVSNYYINNIQKTGNYPLFDQINVITFTYYDGLGNVYNRSISYYNSKASIPIISISMPYEEWFGNDGLYNNIAVEHEKRAEFEYFGPNDSDYLRINTQVKLGGNWSLGYPLRTLNLNFKRNELNEKQETINLNIFGEKRTSDGTKLLNEFDRLRLHSGGNTFESSIGFNDALLHNLMYQTNVSTSAYRPCITYLNGEYWGIYYIREHMKKEYFETHYNLDSDIVAIYDYRGEYIFNDGDDSDSEFFTKMNQYLTKDFSSDEVYNTFVEEFVDEDSLIDVIIAQSYAGNWDFVGNYNNLKVWRTTTIDSTNPYADGRLRFCIHDADFSFMDYTNFLDKNHVNSYAKYNVFVKLMENDNFKEKLFRRADDLINSNLSSINANMVLYQMVDEIKEYKLNAMIRWGNPTTYNQWIQCVTDVSNFIDYKYQNYLDVLSNTLKTY